MASFESAPEIPDLLVDKLLEPIKKKYFYKEVPNPEVRNYTPLNRNFRKLKDEIKKIKPVCHPKTHA